MKKNEKKRRKEERTRRILIIIFTTSIHPVIHSHIFIEVDELLLVDQRD